MFYYTPAERNNLGSCVLYKKQISFLRHVSGSSTFRSKTIQARGASRRLVHLFLPIPRRTWVDWAWRLWLWLWGLARAVV